MPHAMRSQKQRNRVPRGVWKSLAEQVVFSFLSLNTGSIQEDEEGCQRQRSSSVEHYTFRKKEELCLVPKGDKGGDGLER